jgi:hypothetical protein
MGIRRTIELDLEYQAPIRVAPISPGKAQSQAASSDEATMDFWRQTWIRNVTENKRKFGSFADNGIHKLVDIFKWKPCIIIGAGPSLKHYAKYLRAHEDQGRMFEGNPGIPVISCLHNFAYLVDLGVKVDYWITLDAGDIVIDEMFEGGTQDKEVYREFSKTQKLLSCIVTNPYLWENWRGEVIWYNAVMPDKTLTDAIDAVECYSPTVSSGGNVLGAAFYTAKAICGANPIIFMGADFSFSYEKKFHAWNSPYDKMGQVMYAIDVYGNKAPTWQSYYNFKLWFDSKVMTVPGEYINCSDGLFGAYPDGNIIQVKQSHIEHVLEGYRVSSRQKPIFEKVNERYTAGPYALF